MDEYDLPKTQNPEKWTKDVGLSKDDFKTNNVGGTDLNDLCKKIGGKPKFEFRDGKAINLETGEVINLGE